MQPPNRPASDGYHLLLWPYSADEIDAVRKMVSQGIVEGVVLMEVRTVDERVSFLLDADIPFTTIGRTGGHQAQAYVDTDFEAMGAMAVEYVAGLGHTDIGVSCPIAGGPGCRARAAW